MLNQFIRNSHDITKITKSLVIFSIGGTKNNKLDAPGKQKWRLGMEWQNVSLRPNFAHRLSVPNKLEKANAPGYFALFSPHSCMTLCVILTKCTLQNK